LSAADDDTWINSKAGRLLNRAIYGMNSVYDHGHTARLEMYIAWMQLSAMMIDGGNAPHALAISREVAENLRKAFQLGANDENVPVQSTSPFAFVVSYPRSGNTLVIQQLASALHGQIFGAMEGLMTPFSKNIYPAQYPFPRLVKDHVARLKYRPDKTVVIIRDGRDTVISLAYMTLMRGLHSFRRRDQLADFIRWTANKYHFGSWGTHMRAVRNLLVGPDKLAVKYEDYISGPQTLVKLVRFVDPDSDIPDHFLSTIFSERDTIFDNLRSRPAAKEWGLDTTFEPDSLFYEWSQARKGSSWRQSWDAEAKKAFHETGATEFLLEYGYEADPDWWRA
jgi:hypothetical protein